MTIKIFDISEGKVTINENVLLIPELKAIVDNYEDPIPPLCFVHYMTDPLGPYANLPTSQKEEIILEDYDGDYTVDDEPIYKAIEKLNKMYETPSMSLLRDAKVGLETLGNHLRVSRITEGKEGNFAGFIAALKSIGKISQEFRMLEKEVEEELRIRGGGEIGYDEI